MTKIINGIQNHFMRYFFNGDKNTLISDTLSGITVSLALIPEAIAFAFVAGVSPLLSLQTAIIMGIVAGVFTGRPGLISSSTAAIAIVVAPLVASYGLEYLFATVILMGVIQLLIGLLKLGKYTSIIPHSVVLGFLNGLAILIFLAQIDQFKVSSIEVINGIETTIKTRLPFTDLMLMLAMVFTTMAIIHFLPRLTKKVPSTLVAIVGMTIISGLLGYFDIYNFITVQDFAGEAIAGSLPLFHIPQIPFTLETLKIIFPFAFICALVGLTESTLTLRVINDMTNTKGFMNKEYLAQSFGNLINGFFGGMGGDAMVGQSIINIKSGGRARRSGIVAALGLFLFLIFASGFVNTIPLGSLVGLMFIVVISTFERQTINYLGKIPKYDIIVILIVTITTVFFDLATAVIIGILTASLFFAWQNGKKLYIKTSITSEGKKLYKINGLIFFGSSDSFKNLFTIINDPDEIVIDLKYAKVIDQSGLDALCLISKKYKDIGKNVTITRPGMDCLQLIERAKSIAPLGVDITYDPT